METLERYSASNHVYRGGHFGRDGTVAKTREEYKAARSTFNPRNEYHKSQLSIPREKLMGFISALLSSLVPAIKSGRLITAYKHLAELRLMIGVLKRDYGFRNLESTELEVLLAVCTKAWIFPPKWIRRNIISLGDQILESKASYATVALTNARLSRSRHVSKKMRGQYKDAAKEVVLRSCESGLDHELQWETVARIASMVDMPVQMYFAAYMDGRPDVINKYGYSIANIILQKMCR